MNSMTHDNPSHRSRRTWLLWLSVVVQQFTLLVLASTRAMLVNISGWVLPAPVIILWIVYLIAPLLYEQPRAGRKLLLSYATKGWLFVIAALVWFQTYFHFSDTHGTPVSWEAVEDSYHRGERMRHEDALRQGTPGRAEEPGAAPRP